MIYDFHIQEFLEHLQLADVPRYCRTNKQFANFCRSPVGHAIILRKYAEKILKYLDRDHETLDYGLKDYATTQRSNQETPIYYNLYIEFYLEKAVEMLRKNPDMLQKALNRYRNPAITNFGFDPEDSRAREIVQYPETRFEPEINELANLIMEKEQDIYPWIMIEVGMNNWSLYKQIDYEINREFLVQYPELMKILLRTWE